MWVAVFIMVAIVYTYSAEYLFKKVLQDHQRNRIEVVLGIKDDPSGAGYNINQAKIAIGSGGFLGKGFLKGTQTKLKYVPEQDTDFIFCTVGEEFGFWGSVLLIGLYVWLLLRLIFLAERQNDICAHLRLLRGKHLFCPCNDKYWHGTRLGAGYWNSVAVYELWRFVVVCVYRAAVHFPKIGHCPLGQGNLMNAKPS